MAQVTNIVIERWGGRAVRQALALALALAMAMVQDGEVGKSIHA